MLEFGQTEQMVEGREHDTVDKTDRFVPLPAAAGRRTACLPAFVGAPTQSEQVLRPGARTDVHGQHGPAAEPRRTNLRAAIYARY